MTSISHMSAECPACGADVLMECAELELTIGDSEDVGEIQCPSCTNDLNVELLAAFEVTL